MKNDRRVWIAAQRNLPLSVVRTCCLIRSSSTGITSQGERNIRHFHLINIETFVLALVAMLLPSCMHMGRSMMQDGSEHQSKPGPIVEKEVIVDNVKALVVLPAMEVERKAVITLKLIDTKTAQPISGAKIRFHHDDSESHGSGGEQEMEASGDGYQVSYKAAHAGEQSFTFIVAAIGERKLDPVITIVAKQTVAPHQQEHDGGMMGMSNTSTYVIIGSVVMGAIMVAMIVANNGMH